MRKVGLYILTLVITVFVVKFCSAAVTSPNIYVSLFSIASLLIYGFVVYRTRAFTREFTFRNKRPS